MSDSSTETVTGKRSKDLHVIFSGHHNTNVQDDDNVGAGEGHRQIPENIEYSNSSTSTQETEIFYMKWPRRLVYLTMLLHGVGTLMPWNAIINAKSYFVDYKLSDNYAKDGNGTNNYYASEFLPNVGFASQLPSLIFCWANIFIKNKHAPDKRIIWSLAIEAMLFVVTIILALVDTPPKLFFWLTMFSVVFMNMAGGVHQNSVFAVGTLLECTEALIIGANVCGTLVSLMNIISIAIAPSVRSAAVIYFSIALLVLVGCIATYLGLSRNAFYKVRRSLHLPRRMSGERTHPPFREVMTQCWKQCINIFLIFFVTLIVFPTVLSDVKKTDNDFFVSETYFVEVMCFFTFNLFSMIGSSITTWWQFPDSQYLWILVVSRILFIPFFLLCNYQPHRVQKIFHPNWSFGDVSFWFGSLLLGLTNGYFSSLAMIYCSRSVKNSEYAPLASQFGCAFLVTGVFFGINFSRLMPVIVGKVKAGN